MISIIKKCYCKMKRQWHSVCSFIADLDSILLYCILFICFVSFVSAVTVSPAVNHRINISQDLFILKHSVLLTISIVMIIYIGGFINFSSFVLHNYIFFIITFIGLFIVLFIGVDIKGATRWIELFGVSIQPSEFLKPFFIILNAKILLKDSGIKTVNKRQFIKSTFLVSVVLSLLVLEPDFGMTILYFSVYIVQIFLRNIRLRVIMCMLIVMILIFVASFIFIPNVQNRIYSFIKKDKDFSYQVEQSQHALVTGGLFGVGLGNGKIKYNIPDVYTDFITSVIYEEVGGLCVGFLIAIYFIFTFRSFVIIHSFIKNTLYKLIGYSLIYLLVLQIFINFGVNFGILPNKGMTLPLISYGGSSMISTAVIIGLILNLTRTKYRFSKYNIIYNNL